ncbi:hypothetical protein FB563_0742 [Streptomyces puniciscabiei]|uniref:Secreted protein n=1 Tax=Streptomyces puniciscabiei TaxID=164348 RepID=A0A542U9R5_9ACTN|nr:hypothetical protein [Streptomyces puniciscabiei]TQK95822.1 hypothetical protein FB563_0742 [Streptomyces puniciscabiei]
MFRGTTARTVLASLAVVLLALLFSASPETFTPAHTLSEATAKAETGTTPSEQPVGDQADVFRGCASRRARQHPLIPGRAAGAGPSPMPGTAHVPATGASRAHTPAALQVFRC